MKRKGGGKKINQKILEKGRKNCSEHTVELFPLSFQSLQDLKCRTRPLLRKTEVDCLIKDVLVTFSPASNLTMKNYPSKKTKIKKSFTLFKHV